MGSRQSSDRRRSSAVDTISSPEIFAAPPPSLKSPNFVAEGNFTDYSGLNLSFPVNFPWQRHAIYCDVSLDPDLISHAQEENRIYSDFREKLEKNPNFYEISNENQIENEIEDEIWNISNTKNFNIIDEEMKRSEEKYNENEKINKKIEEKSEEINGKNNKINNEINNIENNENQLEIEKNVEYLSLLKLHPATEEISNSSNFTVSNPEPPPPPISLSIDSLLIRAPSAAPAVSSLFSHFFLDLLILSFKFLDFPSLLQCRRTSKFWSGASRTAPAQSLSTKIIINQNKIKKLFFPSESKISFNSNIQNSHYSNRNYFNSQFSSESQEFYENLKFHIEFQLFYSLKYLISLEFVSISLDYSLFECLKRFTRLSQLSFINCPWRINNDNNNNNEKNNSLTDINSKYFILSNSNEMMDFGVDESSISFFYSISQIRSLKKFSLDSPSLTDQDLMNLDRIRTLSGASIDFSIEFLDFVRCRQLNFSSLRWLKKFPNLLGLAVGKLPSVESLPTLLPNLEELSISESRILRSRDWRIFSELKSLKKLHLGGLSSDDLESSALQEFCLCCPPLESLKLPHINSTSVNDCLPLAFDRLRSLKSFSITSVGRILTDSALVGLKNLSELEEFLVFRGAQLTDETLAVVASSKFWHRERLLTLSLHSTLIGDGGIFTLIDRPNFHLRHLNLSESKISDRGLERIFKFLRSIQSGIFSRCESLLGEPIAKLSEAFHRAELTGEKLKSKNSEKKELNVESNENYFSLPSLNMLDFSGCFGLKLDDQRLAETILSLRRKFKILINVDMEV